MRERALHLARNGIDADDRPRRQGLTRKDGRVQSSLSMSGTAAGETSSAAAGDISAAAGGDISVAAGGEISGAAAGDICGIKGEAATADLSGRLVGNSYVLVCPVGHGATGTVWRGIDRTTGEHVA